MVKRNHILLALGMSLLILTTSAGAQEEQWLQYHFDREALHITGSRSTGPMVRSDQPQGVKLPEFKTQEQHFFAWKSPMAKNGRLWIALDRTREQGKWDRLFIDSNGNGHLDDEDAVTAHRSERYYTYFGPVKLVFQEEDGPISYHLNFRLVDVNENRRLYVYSGGWYEGEITVAGQKKSCMLVDYNVNGTFNDKSLEPGDSDRIRISQKGSLNTRWVGNYTESPDIRFVGNYIELDDVLYRLEIARDGAFIKLAGAKDVKFGQVKLPETITKFTAGSENGLFICEMKNGLARLPVGEYHIESWDIRRKDKTGKSWTMRGGSFGGRGNFEIAEESETALEIGEPVTAKLQVNLNGANYEFKKSIRGRLGEYVSLRSDGSDAQNLWTLSAKNTDGSFTRTYPLPDQ